MGVFYGDHTAYKMKRLANGKPSYLFIERFVHFIGIVPDIIPFRAEGDSMVGARDKAAEVNEPLESFDLLIDIGALEGKDVFVHSADAAKLASVLFTPRLDARVPRSVLDGEHRINAVFDPGGDERVDKTVAIERHYLTAVARKELGISAIVRSYELVKRLRCYERAVFEADILPIMSNVGAISSFKGKL